MKQKMMLTWMTNIASERSASKQLSDEDAKENKRSRIHTEQSEGSGINNIEVCEIYIKPRFAGQQIKSFSMNASDEYGHKLNFTKASDREKVLTFIKENKPKWVIGSPPCDSIRTFNEREQVEHLIHLECCTEIYNIQINENIFR